nr:RNA-directed DNA polymerase, eukaryota, reverse transcriptase zinc-binding domain protein [Tanacetum cinerariifolium]
MACRLSKWKLKTQRSKKTVWVKWKHALASKDKGGLGVSSLFALNRVLTFKWVWRFITQGFLLWARVIKALHGYDGKIGQKVKSCYPSLWLDIIHEVEMFKSHGIDLVSLIHSKLGNGVNTSFWEVAWRGGSPFKSLFPRDGVEIQQFEHMKEKVEGCILVDMMDRWFWALKGSSEFTITSEGMPILKGRKSIPGMNSSKREMERGYYSAFTVVNAPDVDVESSNTRRKSGLDNYDLNVLQEIKSNEVKDVGFQCLFVSLRIFGTMAGKLGVMSGRGGGARGRRRGECAGRVPTASGGGEGFGAVVSAAGQGAGGAEGATEEGVAAAGGAAVGGMGLDGGCGGQ